MSSHLNCYHLYTFHFFEGPTTLFMFFVSKLVTAEYLGVPRLERAEFAVAQIATAFVNCHGPWGAKAPAAICALFRPAFSDFALVCLHVHFQVLLVAGLHAATIAHKR